jgi:hypothetical protein
VAQDDVAWDYYTSVKPSVPQQVFDLEVPETKVFALASGLIVYDTMSFHAVSDDAVQEAYAKMLPSANLLSAAHFQAHYMPQAEHLQGLHAGSTAKKNEQPHIFHSKAEVRDAYSRGEIDLGTPVIVRSDK